MIHLDITGFFYRYDADAAGIKTVFDLMQAAAGKTSGNGGVLSFDAEPGSDFCQTITVDYGAGSTPMSRQNGMARPKGRYTYTDDVVTQANRITVPGGVTGVHVWQYYITDEKGKLKSGADAAGNRKIVGFRVSDQPPYGAKLVDGDTVTWRLVAIFGVADAIDANRELLAKKSMGKPLSLKAAMAALR
ncbi:MAG: hypothetical protein FJ309_16285 [Planctomycetes bacterium]|nr:hypothetical protein [Planctomycetota bacterium]